jgi:hypothetical protein
MPPQRKAKYAIETQWIRDFARTYFLSEAGLSFAPERLRQIRLSLVSVRNVLRKGRVICSEKLDGPSALWIVDGKDNDDERYHVVLKVVSEALEVDLMEVEKVKLEETDDGTTQAQGSTSYVAPIRD